MSRHVDFRNHINAIAGGHELEVAELFLRIGTVLRRQPREAFAFQTESRIGLVPVVSEKLHETVVIQMHLQLIQLVERKNLHIVTQKIHRKELAGHVNHESPVRIEREVRSPTFHQSFRLVMNHLEQGTRPPENTFRSRSLNRDLTPDIHPVSFFAQRLVRLA